jgi:uncharacterized membrane protein YfcA
VDYEILLFVAIGFLAQLVDGALGMAFGVIASSSLMVAGAPPAIASAAVHAAEIVTTGLSGASHIWHRNVDRKIFLKLVIPGVCGGILGAFVLTGISEDIIKPIVTLYLAAMAGLILVRVLKWRMTRWQPPVAAVGAGGGFLDAVGGGGWGPLVASTLIAAGDKPRPTVGSVNLAEFFVALAVSITFFTQLDLAQYGKFVIGLTIGGAMAAPLAGYLLRILPTRVALILFGIVVTILAVVNVVRLIV